MIWMFRRGQLGGCSMLIREFRPSPGILDAGCWTLDINEQGNAHWLPTPKYHHESEPAPDRPQHEPP